MRYLIALVLALVVSVTGAQQTTNNLITSGTAHTWTGVTNSTTVGGGFSGGSTPAYNAANNVIYFGYTTATAAQTIAINNALSGSGVQIGGYNYSWQYLNNSSTGGTLAANIKLVGTTGNQLESYNYTMNTVQDGWRTVSGSQDFSQQYGLNQVSSLKISFTGKDARYWAGYYGPQVSNVNVSLKYTADLCAGNPLSSTTCAGYQQAYHDQQCAASALYASDCPGYTVAYQTQQCTSNPLYATTCPGYEAAYKTQQCSINPLYATDCPGYAAAYQEQQCSINPLYSVQCAGYAAAYKTQQCTANALYATDCPGYAVAYKSQQCTANALYATDCPGYAAAYLAQQCNLNGLYDRSCPNYSTAYTTKQLLAAPTQTTPVATTVSTAAGVSDPVVSTVVTSPSTTSPTSVTSVVSVLPQPPSTQTLTTVAVPATTPAASAEVKAEVKKTDAQVAKAVKGNAAAAAKEAAAKAANAKSMEDQVATQGLVVGLMAYVPGFTAYQNALVPDVNALAMARQYSKPNVDNRNAQRGLTGASDAKWQAIVDSQYTIKTITGE